MMPKRKLNGGFSLAVVELFTRDEFGDDVEVM
jgi:hypothetical protein